MGTRIKPQLPRAMPRWRLVSKGGSTRAGAWLFIHIGNRIDRARVPLTKGRIRTTLILNTVILHHRGARSGLERETPLVYFTDGNDVILVASKGGSPTSPAWYHNLLAHPDVRLSDGTNSGPYRAREASATERQRLWDAAVTMYPGWTTYQARAGGRGVPVLVLSPTGGPALRVVSPGVGRRRG